MSTVAFQREQVCAQNSVQPHENVIHNRVKICRVVCVSSSTRAEARSRIPLYLLSHVLKVVYSTNRFDKYQIESTHSTPYKQERKMSLVLIADCDDKVSMPQSAGVDIVHMRQCVHIDCEVIYL